MAGGSKDLRYNVAVDASDASSSLKKLSSDVKRTAKDIEGSFDDSASAGDRFSKTINELAGKLQTEFKSAATAADTLGTALKDAGSKMDVGEAIADLTRMGFTFDEITADADKFATSLKQLDDVKLQGVHELDSVAPGLATKLDDVNKSADSSKSALANMVGNTAQDLGEIGGVVGSLGVGLGQLGEYAADAAFSGESVGSALTSMAKVAGPMAALAAATYLVSNAMKTIDTRNALKEDQVKAFTKAMKEGGNVTQDYADHLRDLGKIEIPTMGDFGRATLGLSDGVKDITKQMFELGLSVDQFSEMAVGGEDVIRKWSDAMLAGGADASKVLDIIKAATDGHEAYVEAQKNATISNRVFGKTTVAVTREFEDAADALQKWADETAHAVLGQQAFNDALAGADWGGSALDGAVTAMTKFSDAHFGLVDIAADSEEAFDKLSESVEKNGKTFDVTTDKGRANQKALEDVARTLDTKLAAAYKDAGGDQAKFTANAKVLAEQTLTRLAQELGLNADETKALGAQLGLLPEDIETRYKLAGDEEAKLKIGLLQGAIDNLPVDVQTQVTQKIIVGDYQGALAVVQAYYSGNPATVPSEVDPPTHKNMTDVLNSLNAFFKANPVTIGTTLGSGLGPARDKGGTVGPGGAIAAEIGPEFATTPGGRTVLLTAPTVVPSGTRVTSRARTRQILRGRVASSPAAASVVGFDVRVREAEREIAALLRPRTARINVHAAPATALLRVNGGGT